MTSFSLLSVSLSALGNNKSEGEMMLEAILMQNERSAALFWDIFSGYNLA